MFNVTFLGARVPLVKAFTQEGVKPYPNVKRVTSYEHACANIQQLHELINDHAKQRHAFFTGKLVKPHTGRKPPRPNSPRLRHAGVVPRHRWAARRI